MVTRTKSFITISVSLILGITLGFITAERTITKAIPARISTTQNKEYSFINQAIVGNIGKHYIVNFKELRTALENLQKKHPGKSFIYFAYLNNAAWVGLQERELFDAVSTVKVPLAMTIYKMAEEGKLSLDEHYSLEQLDLNQDFGTLYKVGENAEFTIKELVEIMIEHSDNTAANALYKSIERLGVVSPLTDIYNAMGWEYNDFGKEPDYQKITTKLLSNMFIALYNATYISPENSQELLSFLTQSEFNDKIVAGVPKDTPVAHKIGVSDVSFTYSDCGIVYAPNRHYLLCVASEGVSETQAQTFMKQISEATYDFVINH